TGRKRQRGKDGLAVALVAPTEDYSFPQPPSATEQGQTPTALMDQKFAPWSRLAVQTSCRRGLSPAAVCSTPFGVTEAGTSPRPSAPRAASCAQRLVLGVTAYASTLTAAHHGAVTGREPREEGT